MKRFFVSIVSMLGLGLIFLHFACSHGTTIAPISPNMPTPSMTPTLTGSPTSTITSNATKTLTNSPTVTASFTVTSTFTLSSTPTLTRTYTQTGTPTSSPTVTATATITNTPTITSTPTITYTPTITSTPTWSPTVTPTSIGLTSSWRTATTNPGFPSRERHGALSYNGKLWVMGGLWVQQLPLTANTVDLNDVWSSSDGVNWTQTTASAAFGAREWFSSTVFNNEMWVIGGYGSAVTNSSSITNYSDAWYSTDGVTWTAATQSAPFSAQESQAVSFSGKIWNISGSTTKTYYSSDGANWTAVPTNPPFDNREAFQALVYNNLIWVIGGYDISKSYDVNDVWYSSDGINWTEATSNAAFPSRENFSGAVFNNAMWIFGGGSLPAGYGTYTYPSDAWYSTDGVNWYEATASAAFGSLRADVAAVLGTELFITAGVPGLQIGTTSTVWESP